MPLTDRQIKALQHGPKQRVYVDGLGLELLVTPAGSKVWRVRYRFAGEQRRDSIGRYPDMGLAAARVEAGRIRTMVWRCEDPRGEPEPEPAPEPESASLDDVIDRYLADHAPAWKPNTERCYRSAIATFRAWAADAGIVDVGGLDPRALAAYRAAALARPRRAKAKGGSRRDVTSTGARRSTEAISGEIRPVKTMLETLRKAGVLALSSDAIADNLALPKLEHAKPDPLRPSQIRDLIDACRRHDAKHRPIESLVVVMLLGGFRLGEALRLTWADVDLDEQTVRVVPGKTGAERTVDLGVSPALARRLGSMRSRANGPRVFDHSKKACRLARLRLMADFGAPAFLWSVRNSRPGERSAPTLRSTCGCYLTCAPAIFGAASVYMSAAQLGHSVDVAQRHYLGRLRRIPADAKTLEGAMGIADMLDIDAPRLRIVR